MSYPLSDCNLERTNSICPILSMPQSQIESTVQTLAKRAITSAEVSSESERPLKINCARLQRGMHENFQAPPSTPENQEFFDGPEMSEDSMELCPLNTFSAVSNRLTAAGHLHESLSSDLDSIIKTYEDELTLLSEPLIRALRLRDLAKMFLNRDKPADFQNSCLSDLDLAIEKTKEALSLPFNNLRVRAELMNDLGYCYLKRNNSLTDIDSALLMLNEVFSYSNELKTNDNLLFAEIALNLGDAFLEKNKVTGKIIDFDHIIQRIQKALDLPFSNIEMRAELKITQAKAYFQRNIPASSSNPVSDMDIGVDRFIEAVSIVPLEKLSSMNKSSTRPLTNSSETLNKLFKLCERS